MLEHILGQTIGIGSLVLIYFMGKYSDHFSDGNVGGTNE